MTPYLHPRYGWQVDCPECGGYGFYESAFGEPDRTFVCDACNGEGHTDPHVDDFDGATVLHNGRVITVSSNGDWLSEDGDTPIDMADLLPVPALQVAA